ISLRDLFTSLYDFLRLNYRNEYVYKTALVNKIIFGKHSPKTSSSSIELPIKNSIVDVAVFNGTSTAYEIKTEYDSPKRLITQAPDYLDV
ncbi:sce7726 family protein, partial [Escherichia coli]